MSFIMNLAAGLFFERPARNKTPDQLAEMLNNNGHTVAKRIENAAENEKNHQTITHIIGIERWSQQRARVALGESFNDEEYDVYRPAKDVPFSELLDLFNQTRAESVELAQQFSGDQLEQRVQHNDFGNLTARAWFQYINSHGGIESRRLR